MGIFKISLLLCIIIAIHISKMETKEILYYESIAEQKAVDSLVEVQAKQALPLILLLNGTKMELWFPKNFEKVFTDEGRIINGTRFALENNQAQMMFCPKEDSDEHCLAPKEFQDLEPLECVKEPLPQVEEQIDISCGANRIGKLFYFFYEICPGFKKLKYLKKNKVDIHNVCYDKINQKTIFTHHRILHPELLDSKILRQEHNVQYNMANNDRLAASKIRAQIEEIESQHQIENQDSKKHVYKIQKLIPTEDMTFALWKKVTHNYYNVALQHEALIQFWNEINDHIRNFVKKMDYTGMADIYTGVFDLPSTPREDGQISNVWVKLIIFARDDFDSPIRGLVILINNFIDNGASEPVKLSEQAERTIFDYCEDDRCDDTLKKKFQEVGGRVRCCAANEEFKGIFRWHYGEVDASSSGDVDLELLHIPGINEPVEGNLTDKVQ